MFKFKTVVAEFKYKYVPWAYFLVRAELAVIEH